MPELVLYDIRLLAKQFLRTVLDIEVDQSVARYCGKLGGLYPRHQDFVAAKGW